MLATRRLLPRHGQTLGSPENVAGHFLAALRSCSGPAFGHPSQLPAPVPRPRGRGPGGTRCREVASPGQTLQPLGRKRGEKQQRSEPVTAGTALTSRAEKAELVLCVSVCWCPCVPTPLSGQRAREQGELCPCPGWPAGC